MAASPSPAKITASMRKGLQSLARRLAEKGIYSRYRAGTRDKYPRLLVDGANVAYAEYRLLCASNGECAGLPQVAFVNPLEGLRVYSGWDAFDKIERRE